MQGFLEDLVVCPEWPDRKSTGSEVLNRAKDPGDLARFSDATQMQSASLVSGSTRGEYKLNRPVGLRRKVGEVGSILDLALMLDQLGKSGQRARI